MADNCAGERTMGGDGNTSLGAMMDGEYMRMAFL